MSTQDQPGRLSPLTADECLALRRLPLPFDDMLRAAHAAGADSVAAVDRVQAAYLASRLDALAAHFVGAGDVSKDLAAAARLLKVLS